MNPEAAAEEWFNEVGRQEAYRFLSDWNDPMMRKWCSHVLPPRIDDDAQGEQQGDLITEDQWLWRFADTLTDLLRASSDSGEAASEYEKGRAAGLRYATGTDLDIFGSKFSGFVAPIPGTLERAETWYFGNLESNRASWSYDDSIMFSAICAGGENSDAMTDFFCGELDITPALIEGFLVGWRAGTRQETQGETSSTDASVAIN